MNQFKEIESFSDEDNFDYKKEFFKYLYFWKIFVLTTLTFFIVAFLYLRYTNQEYISSAKIKIIDKKESSLELPTASDIFSHSKINLENEIEVIKSQPIVTEVVRGLNLHTSVIAVGSIMQSLVIDYPFEIELLVHEDSISSCSYNISLTKDGFEIRDINDDQKKYSFVGSSSSNYKHDLPFNINKFNRSKYLDIGNESYNIHFVSVYDKAYSLKESIQISQIGKESDIIQISHSSTNYNYSNNFINELIKVFNEDGIKDRQLIHKRTIDFVNNRYAFLSLELDSIEVVKKTYKVENNLTDLNINSSLSVEQSFKSEENIFSIDNEISVTKMLIDILNNAESELLPSNIGIESNYINTLISNYNQIILDRKKIILSAGKNNPSVKQIDDIISDSRANIILTLKNHRSKLNSLKKDMKIKYGRFNNEVSKLPEKEKMLRAIERSQTIKEALYLFLLQKREEAEVSYAVTEPSIKVVEYATSNGVAISPKRNLIYLIALALGLFIPFTTLYILFFFNNKIYSKEQFQSLKIPLSILGELPQIEEQSNKTILSSNERSPLAESFRVLVSNLKFYKSNTKKSGEVIIITSTIKGEGKTFTAVNTAYILSSLNKKVLLIGADLHNPQIHSYLDVEKDNDGLSSYLVDKNFDWKKTLVKPKAEIDCDVLIGGKIPPNPAQLLNNGNLDILIENAKKEYDYVIIDTPPSLLVSDTLSISHLGDFVLFVVRCNHTKIPVLDFIKDKCKKGLLKDNSLIVLNGLGANNKYGYGYAYNYNYGYRYNYSYNYNYGYGYEYKSE